MTQWDFWGGPAVATLPSSEVGASSVPSWEAGILFHFHRNGISVVANLMRALEVVHIKKKTKTKLSK